MNSYFWRAYDQKEIDCIEDHSGVLHGFEFKWGMKEIPQKTSREFLKTYPGSVFATVNKDTFEFFYCKRSRLRDRRQVQYNLR